MTVQTHPNMEALVDGEFVYSYDLDNDSMEVVFFANDNEPLPPFPSEIDGYRVHVIPIPPPNEGV